MLASFRRNFRIPLCTSDFPVIVPSHGIFSCSLWIFGRNDDPENIFSRLLGKGNIHSVDQLLPSCYDWFGTYIRLRNVGARSVAIVELGQSHSGGDDSNQIRFVYEIQISSFAGTSTSSSTSSFLALLPFTSIWTQLHLIISKASVPCPCVNHWAFPAGLLHMTVVAIKFGKWVAIRPNSLRASISFQW